MNKYWRHVLLILVIIVSFVAMMSKDPFGQDLQYHSFADHRSILGIPSFFNVTSNIPFLFVGLIGLIYCLNHKQKEAPWSWAVFFLGITLVCFGSAYYHRNPNNRTLVWDRLPMTVGFMGLFIALFSEYVNPKIEKYLLFLAIVLGLSSVIYWHYVDDLRFYYLTQLIPLVTIPVVLILFKARYTHSSYLIFALLSYLLAKITELSDKEIFSFSGELLSGHSLKQLLASCGPYLVYLMLKNRKLKSNLIYNPRAL